MPTKKYCFIVSKIGIDGTPIRETANAVKDKIIKPAIEFDYDIERADTQAYPGDIGMQIANSIVNADLVVADVTPDIVKHWLHKPIFKFNPNVIYEVGLRHALNLPIIVICDKKFLDNYSLPFDLSTKRTIPFDIDNPNEAIETIKKMLQDIENPNTFNLYSDCSSVLSERGISLGHLISGRFSHLISWELSGQLEINAKNVLAISHNLNWASSQIDKLIEDVKNNPTQPNKHCYILVDKDPNSNNNRKNIEAKVKASNLESHFEIRTITTAEYEKIMINAYVKEIIPLHSDFVIYENTNHPKVTNGKDVTFLVLSTSDVPSPTLISTTSQKMNYDVIIESPTQVNIIYHWFKNMWNEIGNVRKRAIPPLPTFIDLT